MKKTVWVISAILVAAGSAYFFWQQQNQTLPTQPPPIAEQVEAPVPVLQASEPAVLYPLADKPIEAATLPELTESDNTFRQSLAGLLGKKWLDLFVDEGIIRKIVATVDNLPRKQVPASVLPVSPVTGTFRTSNKDGSLVIASSNATRYTRYARLARAVDADKLVEFYVRFYPLFQKAYQALGYPNAYFNDRLVVAIDDLLASPNPTPPVKLAQPKIMYEYADAELEARTAGQKIMMRMGAENADQIKAVLREIRQKITRKDLLAVAGNSAVASPDTDKRQGK